MKLNKKLASMFLSVTLITTVVAAPVQAATSSTDYNYVMSLITKIQSGQKITTPAPTTPTKPTTPAPTNPAPTTPAPTNPTPTPTPTTPAPTTPSTSTYTPSQFEQRVVDLVNIERQKAGLKPLVADSLLMKGAHAKSQDMVTNNYFSHTSPKYGSPFAMMKTFGVKYSAAGENIASGQTTPESVVKAWMNSAGHRANILSTKYGKIGVGYAYKSGGNYHHYWTQWFTN